MFSTWKEDAYTGGSELSVRADDKSQVGEHTKVPGGYFGW